MLAWFADLTQRERRTLIGCVAGWSLDGFDVQAYAFVIPSLLTLWHFTTGQAGEVATIAMLATAFGGWMAGALSDRYGRVRLLQATIAFYAIATVLCGVAQNFNQLFLFRCLQGIGWGGEWAAGMVLIGEVIRDKYRGRAGGVVQAGWAIGFGSSAVAYAALFAILPEEYAWRAMFWVGAPFAVVLLLWIRKHVEEPEIFGRNATPVGFLHIFSALRPPYLSTTWRTTLMVVGATGGSNALLVWLPTYFKTVRQITTTGTGAYSLVFILGTFFGYIIGAYMSDAIGRKWTFLISTLGSVVLVIVYMAAPISTGWLLPVGFAVGIVMLIMFGPMGAFLTELYPTAVRGVGQGFCYNAGRGFGSISPLLVGLLAPQLGLGLAIAVCSVGFYAMILIALMLLPETLGRPLASLEEPALTSRANEMPARRIVPDAHDARI
jgi:MFS family permease